MNSSKVTSKCVPALLNKNICVMDVTARQRSASQNSVHAHYARVTARVVQKGIHIPIWRRHFDVRIDDVVVFGDEFVE